MLPADKAICHRAALLCALTKGVTELTPWSPAEDCQKTLGLLQQLGVSVSRTPEGIRIEGVGLSGLRASANPLDCGESGTTMRLACGLLAGQPFQSELTARDSLRQRPMRRVVEPLSQMGARLEGSQQGGDVYPPLTVTGRRPLSAIRYTMPIASAQVKSAILLAGLYAGGRTEVIEPVLTRDHTEGLLDHLGAPIKGYRQKYVKPGGGVSISLEGPVQRLRAPGRLSIPADPSSAAFFIVAALLVPDSKITLPNVALNRSRVHFLDVLKRMGANIHIDVQPPIEGSEWEPRGTITAKSSSLRGVRLGIGDTASMIDELPILMVAACAAEGETGFEGVQELTVKESNRLQAMNDGLNKLGARPDVLGQDMMKIGGRSGDGPVFCGATVESAGDHRIAMSLAIAGLLAEGETRIHHAECVAKSFPDFFECLASVTGGSSVKTIDPVR